MFSRPGTLFGLVSSFFSGPGASFGLFDSFLRGLASLPVAIVARRIATARQTVPSFDKFRAILIYLPAVSI